jgi:hypothetical protein
MPTDLTKLKLDRFDPEVLDLIGFANRDDLDKVMSGCNDSDKRLILKQYREIMVEVNRQIRSRRPRKIVAIPSSWWEHDFKIKPPTLKEFVEDPKWLGATLMPSEDSEGMFPTWKQILMDDFEWNSYIHNLVITGSLGIGKTYIMVTLLLYRLTLCTLLKNPQMVFGLTRGCKIVYNILSVTKQAVSETAFGDARNFMSKSTYFLEDCNFDPDSKYSNFRVELPGDVFLTAGSKGWHVLGRNVLGVALDEGNWRNEADPDTKAYDLYNEVRVRIANRFMRAGKFLPAISILASSAKDESSFTEQVIREIEKANDPVHQKVYRNAVYRIKRHVLRLTGEWFKVAYGLKTQEPYILTGIYNEQGVPQEGPETHEAAPTGASTELVPVEYLPEFKRRTRVALQSIAGISTGGSNRFFPSVIDIERCIELAEADGVINPCRKDSPKLLPLSMEDGTSLWDYLDHNKFLTKIQSRIMPKRHPHAARFAHLDLATTGMAGLAICHLVGNQRVDGVINRLTGDPYSEYRLIVEYDFILTIVAGRSKPISLEKIQNFILWLIQECGYRFGLVTADQFQSVMPLQMLQSRNVDAEILSLDRDKKVYTAWRQAFQELRLRPYRQDMMIHEAENLVDLESDKKIDHPKNGSKDTSDAAAGAYFNAIESDEKSSVNIDNVPSIHGNYALSPQSAAERPPIEIPLPLGYTKIRSFS